MKFIVFYEYFFCNFAFKALQTFIFYFINIIITITDIILFKTRFHLKVDGRICTAKFITFGFKTKAFTMRWSSKINNQIIWIINNCVSSGSTSMETPIPTVNVKNYSLKSALTVQSELSSDPIPTVRIEFRLSSDRIQVGFGSNSGWVRIGIRLSSDRIQIGPNRVSWSSFPMRTL